MWRGEPKAITATAHKLARLVYTMLLSGASYVDAGPQYCEEQYRVRAVQSLKHKAQALGFQLRPTETCNTITLNQRSQAVDDKSPQQVARMASLGDMNFDHLIGREARARRDGRRFHCLPENAKTSNRC
jgi:hypothetical protein